MIDLSGFKYEEPGLPVPEQEFNFIVSKVTSEIPKKGGEEFVRLHYKILYGLHAGKIVPRNLFLWADKDSVSYRISKEHLDWLRKLAGMEDAKTLEELIGVKVRGFVKHTESNGIVYASVNSIFEIKADEFNMAAANTAFTDDDIPDMGASAMPF